MLPERQLYGQPAQTVIYPFKSSRNAFFFTPLTRHWYAKGSFLRNHVVCECSTYASLHQTELSFCSR